MDIKVRDLNFRSRSYWLRRLENHGRKERVVVEDYTVEHILPQNEALSKEWRDELGADWQRIQQDWLHTLGNLTLTGYNSEYSDRSFAYKRDDVTDKDGNPIGFAHSPLKLNLGLGHVAIWDELAIKARKAINCLQQQPRYGVHHNWPLISLMRIGLLLLLPASNIVWQIIHISPMEPCVMYLKRCARAYWRWTPALAKNF